MVLDATLLNTQHYKVWIKEKELCPPLHLGVVDIEKGAFGSLSTMVVNLIFINMLKEPIIIWQEITKKCLREISVYVKNVLLTFFYFLMTVSLNDS